MTLGERIKIARMNVNLKQSELASILGVSNTTISNWEKGVSKPDVDTFEFLCGALNVTPNQLLPQKKLNNASQPNCLQYSLHEENHIKKYRTLDEYGKKAVDFILNLEYDRINAVKVNPNTTNFNNQSRQLPVHDLPASAGRGVFLDSDDYEMVTVDSSVPLDANFGVRISGDSMEPKIHDGDIVWVKQQQTLENGQIGIFILNNEGFCKKYHISDDDCRLVSLNKKYDDIVIQEYDECRIFGKVL